MGSGEIRGVFFADGPTGRRAVVSGTGIDVWEVIATWMAAGESFDELRANYEWLTDEQLRNALEYYDQHREEIDMRLAAEEALTPEHMRERYPFLIPMGG